MGVVKRQAIKKSAIAYTGALIGIASQLWIYPLAFDLYGDFQFVLAMIWFFVPIASLGILGLVNRFFPYFEEENRGNNFLSLLLLALFISFTLFALTILGFNRQYFALIEYLEFDIQIFKEYRNIIIGGVLFQILLTFFASFSLSLKRVVVPYILSTFSWKFMLPLLILLFIGDYIDKGIVFKAILPFYVIISTVMFLYIFRLNKIKFSIHISPVLKENYKSMIKFSAYSLIFGYGHIFAFTIDKIMMRGYTTSYDTGVYSSLLVLSGLILYPYDALLSISTPLIAKNWKEENVFKIKELNKKVTNILSLVVPSVFVLIYINLEDISTYTSNPEAFASGTTVFFYLGLSKILNGIFGLNGLTINFSKYYYVVFVTTILLGCINVYLNSILIPDFGMKGAAIASFISLSVSNLLHFLFNWIVFGIQPFDEKVFMVLVVILLSTIIALQPNISSNTFINIVLRTSVFLVCSVPVILYFKWVPEVNQFLNKNFRSVFSKR